MKYQQNINVMGKRDDTAPLETNSFGVMRIIAEILL